MAFDLVKVKHAMLGSLPIKIRSDLNIGDALMHMQYEYLSVDQTRPEKTRLEQPIFSMYRYDIEKIMIYDEKEPNTICIVPTDDWCNKFNKEIHKLVVDKCSDIQSKRQLIFFTEQIPLTVQRNLLSWEENGRMGKSDFQQLITRIGSKNNTNSTCSPKNGISLRVAHVQFGTLPGKGLTTLGIKNSKLSIEIECYFMDEVSKEISKIERYKVALSTRSVNKIIVNYECEPLLVCVVPSKKYCDIVNKGLKKDVLDSQGIFPAQRQITFSFRENISLFKEFIQQKLPELQKIAPVTTLLDVIHEIHEPTEVYDQMLNISDLPEEKSTPVLLNVGDVQLGSLKVESSTELSLQNSALRIILVHSQEECTQEEGHKKRKMSEKFSLVLRSKDIDKMIINYECEPLLLCVVPSKTYSEIVNKELKMNVLDAQSEVPVKRQIVFSIQDDPLSCKKLMERQLSELQEIAPVSKLMDIMHKM